jgi:predicted RND superfamily exporter protein
MNGLLHRLNLFFERAPGLLLPWRWTVLAAFFLVTAFMSYGLYSKFAMDMSLESWFNDDDPVKLQLDDFRQQFGSDDGIYMVYRAKGGDVFSLPSAQLIAKLHSELDDLSHQANSESLLTRIERIDSLYNVRYQSAMGDDLLSNKLLSNDFPTTQTEMENRRQVALAQSGFELAYYSKDFKFGGMRIKTDFGTVPITEQVRESGDNLLHDDLLADDLLGEDDFAFDDDDLVGESGMNNLEGSLEDSLEFKAEKIEYQDMQMTEYLDFMTALRQVTEKPEYQGFEFHYSGNAAMMEFAMNSMKQAGGLMMAMILVIVLLLWFLFRSLSAVIWPVVLIITSVIWTLGLFSLLGIMLSNMVTLTFMMILAVGIADCVHVLSTYSLYRKEGAEHTQAMALAYRKTGVPIFLTTITTMAGMSALMASNIPQIGIFGLSSSLGVFVAFLLTVLVLPVLMDIWHPERSLSKLQEKQQDKQQENPLVIKRHWLQPLLDGIPDVVKKHSKLIVITYACIFIVFFVSALNVKVDSNFVELTREGSSVRVAAELIDDNMMGGQNMEVMLNFDHPDALKDSQVLKTIESFQDLLLEKYPQYVVKTFALTDFVKETHKVMNEGKAEFDSIPDDSHLAGQLLYLFDNSNPTDRSNLVSDDYSITHISIMLKNAGSYEYTGFFDSVNVDIENTFSPLKSAYPNLESTVTGTLPLMMKLIDHISWAQIKSFAWALGIISILLVIALGSIQGGLISVAPNMLPAIFTFGAMGLLGYSLDTDTLVIAPLIIGIAVDDTIHFMAHYRDAWFKTGDVEASLKSTIKEVGQAVTFTTLILAVGFGVLSFSDYLGLAKTGMFGSLAIVVALSCDLLLLPAIISCVKPDLGRERYLQSLDEDEKLLPMKNS